MPCFSPLVGYRGRSGGIVFARGESSRGEPMSVPCGQCIGCRLERSRQWAVRCMHEASLHDEGCFLTLTYDDENLPVGNSLDKSHFQKFIRSLRKRTGQKMRYFQCGEYGEQNFRPHYHALLFGFEPMDKEPISGSFWASRTLEDIWGRGFVGGGDITFDSAAYVARYCLKKVTGEAAHDHYLRSDFFGEAYWLQPEYVCMSRRPGIGREWIDKFKSDVYPHDNCIVNSFPSRPPRYYDNVLELDDPELLADLKRRRISRALSRVSEQTAVRLETRRVVLESKLSLRKRSL